MKKTTTVTLGKSLFHIEEDAYEKLKKYLEAVGRNLAELDDREGIIADIESRIAERLIKGKKGTESSVIDVKEVEEIISIIGPSESFVEEESAATAAKAGGDRLIDKRLYRDTEAGMIAGVASGLASYFGIDPVFVRLAFVVATLVSGFGFIAYLVCWAIIPEAKTPIEKLEMKGEPVTTETLKKATEVRRLNFVGRLIREIFSGVATLISKIFSFVGIIIGAVMAIVSAILLIALITVAVAGSTGAIIPLALFLDPIFIPLPASVYLLIVFGFIFTIVPVIIFLLLGLSLVSRRMKIGATLFSVLFGVWLVSTAVITVSGIRTAGYYAEKINRDPEIVVALPYSDFSSINTEGIAIEIYRGAELKLEVIGRKKDVDRLVTSEIDGEVFIRSTDKIACPPLCFPDLIRLKVTSPEPNLLKIKSE